MIKSIEYKYRKHFADYATCAMEDRGIRPWYVAYYSEMQDSAFRSCLKGARLPNPISLIMIAELFECSVNDLLGCKSVDVEPRNHIFDSGLERQYVGEYFINQVERFMKDKGVSVSELAIVCECSENTILNYISNNIIPDTPAILRICNALKCTPSELLGF